MLKRFPNQLFTDNWRAIIKREPGWETTLIQGDLSVVGQALSPCGYRLKVRIVDFSRRPGGLPGDIGMTLSWA